MIYFKQKTANQCNVLFSLKNKVQEFDVIKYIFSVLVLFTVFSAQLYANQNADVAVGSLVNKLDVSLVGLVNDINKTELSDEYLGANKERYEKSRSLYLIYKERLIGQLDKLKASGLTDKYETLKSYYTEYESDVGGLFSSLDLYYKNSGQEPGDIFQDAYSKIKEIIGYYWSKYEVYSYSDSITSRFKPVLHGQSLPSEGISSFNINQVISNDYAPYKVGDEGGLEGATEDNSLAVKFKLEELDKNPIEIFNYVKALPSELYWGQKKGLDATVNSGGNSLDKANLLASMLRESGFESHVVEGVAMLTLELLEKQFQIAEKNVVIKSLRETGQVFKPLFINEQLSGVELKHYWVEANIPYVNYRGVGIETDKRDWIPLDTYFNYPAHTEFVGAPNIELTDVKQFQHQSILAGTDNAPILNYLASVTTGTDFSSETETASVSGYLPVALPFEVSGYYRKFKITPDDVKQKVQIKLLKKGFIETEYFSEEVGASDLYGKNISINFIPATVSDQELVFSLGGMDQVPAFLLSVLPVLEIDGKRIAVGQRSVPMAEALSLEFNYQAPYKKTIEKDLVTGGYYSLAFADSYTSNDVKSGSSKDIGLGAQMLSESAYLYLDHWVNSEAELGKQQGVVYNYPAPSLAIMANANLINYFDEKPVSLQWAGVELDAIYHPVNSYVVDGLNGQNDEQLTSEEEAKNKNLLIALNYIVGLEASWYEAQILKDFFSVDAISADSLIAYAASNGESILTEKDSIDFSDFKISSEIKGILSSAINTGYELLITAQEQTINDWTGYAWVITDPKSGHSGYFLTGAIAGATSTDSSDVIWQLVDPDAEEPSSGLAAFAFLEVAADTGNIHNANDDVNVTITARGISGEPVSNVPVSVSLALGQGQVLDVSTVTTDDSGVASVTVKLGPVIKEGFYESIGNDRVRKIGIASFAFKVSDHVEGAAYFYYGPGEGTVYSEGEGLNKTVYAKDGFGNPVAGVSYTVSAYTDKTNTPLVIQTYQNGGVKKERGSYSDITYLSPRAVAIFSPYTCEPMTIDVAGIQFNYPKPDKCRLEDTGEDSWNRLPTESPTREVFVDPETGVEGERFYVESVLCTNFLSFPVAQDGKFFGNISVGKIGVVAHEQDLQLCDRYIFRSPSREEVKELFPDTYEDYIWDRTQYIERFEYSGLDTKIIETRNVFQSGKEFKFAADSFPGSKEIRIATDKLSGTKLPNWTRNVSIKYLGDDFTKTAFSVKPTAEVPEAVGRVTNNSVVLNQDMLIDYAMPPSSSSKLRTYPSLKIYKDGQPVDGYLGSTYDATGKLKIPSGYAFDAFSKYEVEVELDGERIVSERKKIDLPIIMGFKDKINTKTYVDLSNNQTCGGGTLGNIVVSTDASLTVKAEKYFLSSGGKIKMKGPEINLVDEQLVSAGVLTPYEIDLGTLSPGVFGLKITATSLETGKTESVTAKLNYDLEFEDTLPVSHTLYQGVDLANASLNLSRTDLSKKGNTEQSSFTIGRSYSSKNVDEGYLGSGWQDINEINLYERPCGYVIAKGIRFIQKGSGYEAAKGYHAQLEKIGDDYKLTTVAGTQYYFEKHPSESTVHRVKNVTYADGYELKYAYVNNKDEVRISRIQDSFGRFADYEYGDYELGVDNKSYADRLLFINFNDIETIQYSYDDSLRLNKVSVTGKGFSEHLKEEYTYAKAVRVTKEEHQQYSDANEYPDLEFPDFYVDQMLLASQKRQRLPLLTSTIDPEGQETKYLFAQSTLPKESIFAGVLNLYEYTIVSEMTDKNGNKTGFEYSFADTGNGTAKVKRPIGTIDYVLDNYGSAISITDAAGTETNEFNDRRLLIEHTDKNGNAFTYSYDESGNKTEESSGSWSVEYEYKPFKSQAGIIRNALTKVTTGDTEITYNYNNRCPLPSEVSFPSLRRSFNQECQVTAELDGEGNSTSYRYDDVGQTKSITKRDYASGIRYQQDYQWSDRGFNTLRTDFNGNATRFKYDDYGRVIAVTDANGTKMEMPRDKVGQVLSSEDALGRETAFTYDDLGNVLTESYAGQTKRYTYDDNNNRLSQTDWEGRKVEFEYNDANQLIKETYPLNKSITYERDGNGNATRETLAYGSERYITNREFDFKNRLTSETDAEGHEQSWKHDDSDNLVEFRNKNGVATENRYNSYGLLTSKQIGSREWHYEYNDNGLKIKEKDSLGNRSYYRYDIFSNEIESRKTGYGQWNRIYDGAGNMLSETDPLGKTHFYKYNKINGLIEKADPEGSKWTYTLDDANRIAKEKQPNFNEIINQYDDFDYLTNQSDDIGTVFTREYDAQGNLLSHKDGNGNTTRYTVDALNRTTQIAYPDSSTESFNYNGLNLKTEYTDGNGKSTDYSYDKVGNLTLERNAKSQVAIFAYDAVGNQTSSTDRNGNQTTFVYNDFNELIKTTNALNDTITNEYDNLGRLVKETDAKGYVTQYVYKEDANGRSQITTRNGVTVLTQRFNVGNQVIYQTDANNNRIAYKYDDLGNKLEDIYPLSSVMTYAYDRMSNLTSQRDGENHLIEYDYDARNRKIKQSQGGVDTEYVYDGNGNQTQLKNGQGNTWAYQYDARNRLEKITAPDNTGTEHDYDGNGNLIETRNANGGITRRDYDDVNQLTLLTYPGGESHTYSYDPVGNISYEILANGQQIDFDYDALNRMTSRSDAVGTISYVYDKNSNLISQTTSNTSGQGSGKETFTYDNFDRVLSKEDIYGKLSRYKYDNNGNLTGMEYGWASSGSDMTGVTYFYDAKNRLKNVINNLSTTKIAYYRNDLIKSKTFSNGIVSEYSYNNRNLVTQLSHKTNGLLMHEFKYQYDDNNNTTQESEFNGTATILSDFVYDSQDRLTQATYSGDSSAANNGISTYDYDDNGNRVSESFTTEADVKTKDITYSYDTNDQLTTIADAAESSSTAIGYDQLGNLIQKAKTQGATTDITDYVYDVRNQLKQVQIGGSTVGQFLYDANGLRTYKTETLNSVTSQKRYHYQNLNVIGESDENGNALFNYYHDGQTIIGREDAQADSSDLDKLQSYHHDSLGSIALISKTDGSLNARYQYDAFGNVQNESGNSENNDYTYTGHERDQATGLIYAKARYYDPQLGLFLSRDPFEGYDNTPMSLHRYLYAYQNPLKYVDPDGEAVVMASIGAYLAYTALMSAFDTASEAAIDATVSHVTGEESNFDAVSSFGENMLVNAVTLGMAGKAKTTLRIVEAADTINDARKAKSLTKTVKENPVSLNNTTTTPAERLAKKSEKYGGEEQRAILAKNIKETRGRSQGKSKTSRENSLREAKGEVDGFHKMKGEGYELQDIDIKYNGNQGLDQVYKHKGTGDYAINEAKHGKGLGQLKTDKKGLRQGSQQYNQDRVKRYRKETGDSSKEVKVLSRELRTGNVKSYTTSYKGKTHHEILSPNAKPKFNDPNSVRIVQ